MSRQRKQRLRGTENVYLVVNLNKEMFFFFFNVLKVLYPLLEVTDTFFKLFFFRYLLISFLLYTCILNILGGQIILPFITLHLDDQYKI